MNHVLIIGAGASGLMAAHTLAEKSQSVTLIEARDRIGGRIHTLSSGFSLPMEAGAEFVHGDLPLTLSLIKESASEIKLLSGNRYQRWKGEWQTANPLEEDWTKLDRALQDLKTDTDMMSFLEHHFDQEHYSNLYDSVKGYVEGYDIADLNRVSAMALKEEWEESNDELQYHITGGYIRLINFLEDKLKAAGVSVLLSSPVKEIQWSEGKVKVLTRDGELMEGDKVIVTVPLGVLQKRDIKFIPPLPDHDQAFAKMGFGGVIKFLFEFRNAFWENKIGTPLKEMAFLFSDEQVPTWWTQLPDKTPILTGWLGGPSAISITKDKKALYQIALQSLSTILHYPVPDIEKEMVNYHIADWVSDPYAHGAYAYTTVETPEARRRILQPVKGTLYFAGEALYEGTAMGTVEAALTSGKAAAEMML